MSQTRGRRRRVPRRTLAAIGVALLAVFALVRGARRLRQLGPVPRLAGDPLQWLHVAKYPPSLSYTTLELGLAFLLLALFFALDDGDEPARVLRPLALFGSTAFFYYLLHVHLLVAGGRSSSSSIATATGLVKTWVAAAAVLVVLYPLCVRYRRYKAAHPDGWTRYI